MTGLEGNRQIYLPREIQDRPPRVSIETLGESILNLKGQIDSLLPEGPVIIMSTPFKGGRHIVLLSQRQR